MDGVVPLGYDIVERKLVPNKDEVKTINYIFESYLEVKSIDLLKEKLNSEGIKTKQWQAKSGKIYGKTKWTNSMLGRVLRNQVYIGKVHHKGNTYNGEHKEIITQELFNQVQELLNNQNRRNNEITEIGKYLLFQKIYNEQGEMFKCDACVKTNKSKNNATKVRYNYYITENKRLKCEKIDKMIIELTRQFITSKHQTLRLAENDELAKIDWDNLTNQQQKSLVRHLISAVVYKDDELKLEINREVISGLKEYQSDKINANNETFDHKIYNSADKQTINIIADIKTNKIIPIKVNKALLKAITTGYKYKKMIEEQNHTVDTIAEQEGKSGRYIARIINIGYLSPAIIESIFRAEHSEKLTVIALENISASSIDWKIQEREFMQYQ